MAQLYLARYLAESHTAQADAFHVLLHSGFYLNVIYVGRKVKKMGLSVREERMLRLQCCHLIIGVILGFLGAVILIETIPKFWHPTAVIGQFMILGILIGIAGNFVQNFILFHMKRIHFPLQSDEECRGTKELHNALKFDVKQDLTFSLVALSVALIIWQAPLLSEIIAFFPLILPYVDPSFTIIVACLVIWLALKLLDILKESHHSHHH